MFSTGFKVKALGAAPAYARSARVVRCRGAVEDAKDAAKDAADSFAQDAKDSLKPRVEELRQDESEGTTSFERALYPLLLFALTSRRDSNVAAGSLD